MLKRGQISLFIIVAVIMLGAFGYGFFYLVHSNKATTGSAEYVSSEASLEGGMNSVQVYVQSCLEKLAKEGMDIYGIKVKTASLIATHIKSNIDRCVDFSYFEKMGFTIDRGNVNCEVTITEEAVYAELNYPISIIKGADFFEMDRFNFLFKREREKKITLAEGKTGEEIRLVAENKYTELIIPQGTKVTDSSGNPLTEVKVKVEDKNFQGLSNNPIVGMVIYDMLPNGAHFSPPITIKMRYDSKDVPPGYDENDLRIAWFDEVSNIWRSIPSEVDTVNNIITAKVNHFTKFGTVKLCNDKNADPTKKDTVTAKEYTKEIFVQRCGSTKEECGKVTEWKTDNGLFEVGVKGQIPIITSQNNAIPSGEYFARECKKKDWDSSDPDTPETYGYEIGPGGTMAAGWGTLEFSLAGDGKTCVAGDQAESEDDQKDKKIYMKLELTEVSKPSEVLAADGDTKNPLPITICCDMAGLDSSQTRTVNIYGCNNAISCDTYSDTGILPPIQEIMFNIPDAKSTNTNPGIGTNNLLNPEFTPSASGPLQASQKDEKTTNTVYFQLVNFNENKYENSGQDGCLWATVKLTLFGNGGITSDDPGLKQGTGGSGTCAGTSCLEGTSDSIQGCITNLINTQGYAGKAKEELNCLISYRDTYLYSSSFEIIKPDGTKLSGYSAGRPFSQEPGSRGKVDFNKCTSCPATCSKFSCSGSSGEGLGSSSEKVCCLKDITGADGKPAQCTELKESCGTTNPIPVLMCYGSSDGGNKFEPCKQDAENIALDCPDWLDLPDGTKEYVPDKVTYEKTIGDIAYRCACYQPPQGAATTLPPAAWTCQNAEGSLDLNNPLPCGAPCLSSTCFCECPSLSVISGDEKGTIKCGDTSGIEKPKCGLGTLPFSLGAAEGYMEEEYFYNYYKAEGRDETYLCSCSNIRKGPPFTCNPTDDNKFYCCKPLALNLVEGTYCTSGTVNGKTVFGNHKIPLKSKNNVVVTNLGTYYCDCNNLPNAECRTESATSDKCINTPIKDNRDPGLLNFLSPFPASVEPVTVGQETYKKVPGFGNGITCTCIEQGKCMECRYNSFVIKDLYVTDTAKCSS